MKIVVVTMTIIKRLLALSTLCLFQGEALASCDACAKAALDAASAAISASVGATTQVATLEGQTIEAMNVAVNTGTTTLVESLQLLNQKELTALDGVSKVISLSIDKLAEESSRATDYTVQSIFAMEKELRTADRVMENSKTIGEFAQTLSGEINTARSFDLATGVETKKALKTLYSENMDVWLNDSGYTTSSMEKSILASKDEYWDILPLLQKDVLTDEELNNLHVLMQMVVDPSPQPKATAGDLSEGMAAVNSELARLRKNALSRVAHSILTDALIDKAATIPTDASWLKAYFAIDEKVDDKISFSQFYEAETLGKLLSPDWFMDIKSRTEAGLLREQIYQNSTTNALLSEILKAERNETKLLSLSVLRSNIQ